MNLETGDYEFKIYYVENFTREEVLEEIEKYFQRYNVEFRKKVFEFLKECMKGKNLKFRKSNCC